MAEESANTRVIALAGQLTRSHRLKDAEALGAAVATAVNDHDILTYATAIAFRILFAFAFLSLTAVAFAGVIHLQSIWQHQVGPAFAHVVSKNFYRDVDRSVELAMTARRWWWLSIGLLLTLWQVSSGVRALMGALDRIYELEDRRPFWERLAISVGLGLAICAALAVVGAIVFLFPSGSSGIERFPLIVLRGVLIALVMIGIIGVLLRYTTPEHLGLRFATAGSIFSIVTWVISTAIFAWYLTNYAYAAYQQTFGILSLLVVGMTYLYIASLAFLIGAELDALLLTEEAVQKNSRTKSKRS
jgi:membrane protein